VRNPEGAVVCAVSAAGRVFAPVGHLKYLRRQACRGEERGWRPQGLEGVSEGTAALNDRGSGGGRDGRTDRTSTRDGFLHGSHGFYMLQHTV
jgi:hypothetical protein